MVKIQKCLPKNKKDPISQAVGFELLTTTPWPWARSCRGFRKTMRMTLLLKRRQDSHQLGKHPGAQLCTHVSHPGWGRSALPQILLFLSHNILHTYSYFLSVSLCQTEQSSAQFTAVFSGPRPLPGTE